MKKLLLIVSITVFSFSNAIAVTLYDALNQTYQNNIQLNAEEKILKLQRKTLIFQKLIINPLLL